MTGNVYKNVEATQVKLKPKFFQHLLKYDSSIYEIWNYNPSSNNALDVKSSNIRTLLAPFLAGSIYDVEQERTTWAKVEKVQQGIRVQVFDKSKFFAFDEGSKLYSLESYNNGKTWANLRDLGFQLSLEDGKELGNYFGGLISGSGNGIELQHQSDNNKKQMVEYFLQYIDELDQILIIQAVFKNKKEYEFTQMIKVKAGLA